MKAINPTHEEISRFMQDNIATPDQVEIEVQKDWIIFRVFEPPTVLRIPLFPDMITYLKDWRGPFVAPVNKPTLTTWESNEGISVEDLPLAGLD